ncbi:MAG: family 10 glycosylhydrolase [Armatimonadia bacterium]
MRGLIIGVCLLAVGAVCFGAEVVKIDEFNYADLTALREAWQPVEKSGPAELMAHGNKQTLKIPCPFSQEVNRAAYDRKVNLDLLKAGAITFDFYADTDGVGGSCTIYFHSGNGWYGGGFSANKGWQRISLGKGIFRVEDQPAGWDKVDTIRVNVWRGKPEDSFCAIDNLGARTEDLAVVCGGGTGAEAKSAQGVAKQLCTFLDKTGLRYGVLTDSDVAGGALKNQKLAIFAYSPGMAEETVNKAAEYVEGGGKIIVFYSLPGRLAGLLGATKMAYRPREREGQFANVKFEEGALPGLPAIMAQNSWNSTGFEAGEGAKVIGVWQDAEGKTQGPAVVINDNGAFMGHVLTDADSAAKQAFLMALIGHFVPDAWPTAAQLALAKAEKVGPYATRTELKAWLDKVTPGSAFADKVKAATAAAAVAEKQAQQLLGDKKYPEVLAAAQKYHDALADSYFVAHTPRTSEFRAVWNHSGTGDCGSWEEAMKRLKAGNFNAVVPNMWWGGVAHYDSKLLPHSKTFNEQGDQIAQCVAAGKKYGVEVHPWKVNWNLSTAPQEFVEKMRQEGRLQVSNKGEELRWLCSSNPANFKLELDTMLEVVRNYDVDGVHFDYIRYPGGESCYCNGCRERFEQGRGAKVADWPADCVSGALKAEYQDFRCAQITRLVKAVSEQAHAIKPWIKISAAVFSDYPGSRSSVGQDWVLWCREGWLDFVCPMNYTESDSRLSALVSNQVNQINSNVPLYSGIGQFIIEDDQVVSQMELARANGADGFILFNMGKNLAEYGLPRYAEGMTSEPAILPHNAPRIKFSTAYDEQRTAIVVKEAELPVKVEVVGLGQHRQKVSGAAGKLELQDMEGRKLADLGALPKAGATVSVKVPRQAGMVRVAAVGEMVVEGGAKKAFVVRSRPYSFE